MTRMAQKEDVARFLAQYRPIAERVGAQTGNSPELLLAQWALETRYGKSVIPGTNNLGNIKDFSGAGPRARDNMTGSTDAYRAYTSPEAFADDYAGLIGRRYKGAMGSGNDILHFATALKKGGYAEDPNYVGKLVNVYGQITGADTSGLQVPATAGGRSAASRKGAGEMDALAFYGMPATDAAPEVPAGMSPDAFAMPDEHAYSPPVRFDAGDATEDPNWIDNYINQIVQNA